MRIATWNLERGGRTLRARQNQDDVLRHLAADLLVLTEPGPGYRSREGTVVSPSLRKGHRGLEPWIAIVAQWVESISLDIPFERMASAARARLNGRDVVVYGSVLPWGSIRSHAPELVRDGESALDAFVRIVHEQVADIRELRRRFEQDVIIWAGDFNQTVSGPHRSGSKAKRAALLQAFQELGFAAWNGDARHAAPGLHAIDLICGPCEIIPVDQGRIHPVHNGVTMSDHAGYWIEL
jgi:hypothetical protein